MTTWNADALHAYVPGGESPTDEDVHGMIEELHEEWVPGEVVDMTMLHMWASERFGVPFDQITPQTLKKGADRRISQLKTLFNMVRDRSELRGDALVKDKVARIAKVMREARNSIEACAILCYQIDNVREQQIPDAWDPDSYFKHLTEDEKQTTFQKLLLAVLRKMAADRLRRLDDTCYEEIKLGNNEPTHAWRRLRGIKEYIFDRIQKEADYEEWKCLTNPHDNCDKVVNHLMSSTHIEFPVLVMNRYLWAYNNGLYNVLTDMFFPFSACYISTLADVTPESVAAFAAPHTTHVNDEADTLDASNATTQNGVLVWNICDDGSTLMPETCFRIGDTFYNNCCDREAWPKLAADMQTFRRGLNFGHITDVTSDLVQKLTPVRIPPPNTNATLHEGVRVWGLSASGVLTMDTVFAVGGEYYTNKSGRVEWKTSMDKLYVLEPPTSTDVAVKHFDIDFRFRITPETEDSFDPRSIELPEMERIMEVQELTPDSQEWLVLMMCRLFFPVGYDRWQVVLFVRGIAGSGKSTLAQIIRSFYPPTCITTLSSNIEAKFGLSAIYKGLVCVCAEVREDFGLDQAEWQSAVSGEEVQIAVKSKTAFSHKWDTPFFWLGNELPNYRNASGSVSRRIFMIEFRKKVMDSDPHLFDKFMNNIDLFQRKGVALYHEALRKHGGKDIWAKGVVGRQLAEWFDRVKNSTDQLSCFLSGDKYVFGPRIFMAVDDFKRDYFEFLRCGGHDKVKWVEGHYDAVFQEFGITLKIASEAYPAGSTNQPSTKTWMYGIDVKPDDEGV